MTSLKPYLIRSIYTWIIDNQLTPYLLVSAKNIETALPKEHIKNDKIILNINPKAVQKLSLGNKVITFNACFSGKFINIIIPTCSVMAVYAKENGKGMAFNATKPNSSIAIAQNKKPKFKLEIIK